MTPVQIARKVMSGQMHATAYVFAHPAKYNKARREASMALLDQRTKEYNEAVVQQTAERLARLAAKHAGNQIES
jgi:hypothetical protein